MRFRAIDTFRGLAAILVILFHIPDSVLLAGNQLVAHGYMAVDFFFVLSGFVMSHSYLNRITDLKSARSFTVKRFRRIYPLHLFTLLLFLAFEGARWMVHSFVMPLGTAPFENCTLATFFGNLTLTHSMGLFNHLSWNLPSWSISVEFYVYIFWALMLMFFRNRLYIMALISLPMVVWFVWRFNGNIEYTYDYGFIRCLFGFLLGMYAYLLARRFEKRMNKYAATFTEMLLLVLTGYFISSLSENYHWIMPFWFAIVIVFFSTETGMVARFFAHPRLKFLGELSFSYYLTHTVVIRAADLLFYKVFGFTHTVVVEAVFLVFIFSIIQVLSYFTYRHIELRFQAKSKPRAEVEQPALATVTTTG